MKKLLILLLALCLLPAALALGESAEDALYTIVLRTEEQDVPLGTGVLLLQKDVLLAPQDCLRDGALYAVGADGEYPIADRLDLSAGISLLQLGGASAATPLTLSDFSVMASSYMPGAEADGTRGLFRLYQAVYDLYQEYDALVFSSEEGMLPGGAVLDENGALMALVIARKTEGQAMYTALLANSIQHLLSMGEGSAAFLPVECSWQGGRLTVTWTDKPRLDGVYVLSLSGAENNYYTTFTVQPAQQSIALTVPPGHGYDLQVQWARSESEALSPTWASMTRTETSDGRFAAFGFRQECSLILTSHDPDTLTALQPVAPALSVDMLQTGSPYAVLQIVNRYDVDATIDMPMTVELVAPDGQFYFEELICHLMPEYEAEDLFFIDVTELFDDCAAFTQGGLQPGEYRLRYAIGGLTAGEYRFTLQEAGSVTPTQGFVQEMTLTREPGAVTLDWSAADIPDGASVTAFVQYEGNPFYGYRQVEAGETSTRFFTLPDRWCAVWAVWTAEGTKPSLYPSQAGEYQVVLAAGVAPVDLYGFANVRCGLTFTEPPEATYLPEEPITREMLQSGAALYFQTEDVYTTDTESDGHPLIVALYTPEGYVFRYQGEYVFMPELGGGDVWAIALTDLTENYTYMVGDAAWPAGEYAVRD